jgi:leucyl-tRNA---protein transferase
MTAATDPWDDVPLHELPVSPPYPCPYLPGRTAQQRAFQAPRLPGVLYHGLMARGYRRSGDHFYAMACPDCALCVPLRVPVATFRPSRSQRRACRRNGDVRVEFAAPREDEATYALYRRYLAHQHPTANVPSREEFVAWLYAPVTDTVEARYRIGDRHVGSSVLDVTPAAVSAVSHFFDPDFADRSLGTYSAVVEIHYARSRGAEWYHLGFWIEGAKTMDYKANFQPHELLRDGRWQPN